MSLVLLVRASCDGVWNYGHVVFWRNGVHPFGLCPHGRSSKTNHDARLDASSMLQNYYHIPDEFEPIFSACIQRRPLLPTLNLTLPANLAFELPTSIGDIDKFDHELVNRAPQALEGSAFFHSTDKLGEEMSLTTAERGDGTAPMKHSIPGMDRYLIWLNELVKDEGSKTQWKFKRLPDTCSECQGLITLDSPSDDEVRDLYKTSEKYQLIYDAFTVARAKEAVWNKPFRGILPFIPWVQIDLRKLVHRYHEFVFEAQSALERLRNTEQSIQDLPNRLKDTHAVTCSDDIKKTVQMVCRSDRSLLDALYQEGLTFTCSFLATVLLALGQYTMWRLSRIQADVKKLAEYEFGSSRKGSKSSGNGAPFEEKKEEVMTTF